MAGEGVQGAPYRDGIPGSRSHVRPPALPPTFCFLAEADRCTPKRKKKLVTAACQQGSPLGRLLVANLANNFQQDRQRPAWSRPNLSRHPSLTRVGPESPGPESKDALALPRATSTPAINARAPRCGIPPAPHLREFGGGRPTDRPT